MQTEHLRLMVRTKLAVHCGIGGDIHDFAGA